MAEPHRPTGVGSIALLGGMVILLCLLLLPSRKLFGVPRISTRYLLTMCFLKCRYRVRMLILHLGYLRICVYQALLYYALIRLYLRDKRLGLSVAASLNQVRDEKGDLRDGFKCCHKFNDVMPPNT